MPASREKAPTEPSESHTPESKRGNTHPKPITAGPNPPQSHTAEIQRHKPGAISLNAVEELAQSFPHEVGSSHIDLNSSNNRYHCGFAQ